MTVASLDKEIRKYLPLLDKDEKRSLVGVIKSFLKLKEIPRRPTIEEYNKELDDAEAFMDAGNFVSQEEAEKRAASWH